MKALSWFNRRIRAFELHEQQAAYAFLGLTENEQTAAHSLREQFERELGIRSDPKNESHDKANVGQ